MAAAETEPFERPAGWKCLNRYAKANDKVFHAARRHVQRRAPEYPVAGDENRGHIHSVVDALPQNTVRVAIVIYRDAVDETLGTAPPSGNFQNGCAGSRPVERSQIGVLRPWTRLCGTKVVNARLIIVVPLGYEVVPIKGSEE